MDGRTFALQTSLGGLPARHHKLVGRTGQPTRREDRLRVPLLPPPRRRLGAGLLLLGVRGAREDREEDWARLIIRR